MPFGTHLYDFRRLMELKRYQNRFCFKRRSVAEHACSVAKIAQGLALWETHKFNHPVDMSEVLQRAINHDFVEVETGDIISTTKHDSPEVKYHLDVVEKNKYMTGIEPNIPRSWRPDFDRYILHAKEDEEGYIEGKIIAAADIIDTILECVEEIELNNFKNFAPILIRVTENLTKIDLESVRYFLKYSLQDFGLDIRTYYGENVYDFIQKIDFPDSVF